MLRLPAVLLLTTLAFPFVRAPLCEAGAHEHPAEGGQTTEQRHADSQEHAPSPVPSTDVDCHTLMQCNAPGDLGVIAVSLAAHEIPHPGRPDGPPRRDLADTRYSPETPPPRAI